MNRIATRNPGNAYPMMMTPEVHTSKGSPPCIALRMPSGMEIR